MRIVLTTFYTKNYQKLAHITVMQMQKYCDRYGYYLNVRIIEDDESFHFVKTKDTRKLLEEFDVVMAIEADCLITNMKFMVEDFLDDENELYYTTDRNGVNFGVFVCKSTEWTKQLFDWIELKKDSVGDEQNLFENHKFEKAKIMEHPCFNSIPYQHYYPSLGVIGYKDGDTVTEPTHEQGNFEKGDFICHLPGKTLEERIKIFTEIKEQIVYE